jgi:hypothetical protein
MAAAVNSGAFLLTRDLLRYGRPGGEGFSPVVMGRAATLFVGAAAFFAAARFGDILKTLGLASKIMAEACSSPASRPC